MIGGIQVVSPLGDAGTRSFGDGAEAIDIEGNSLRNLAFPPGVEVAGAETISKDGRFVAYGSCRPCNAGGKGPDTSTHAHLLVVPFDGSPAHELGDVVVVDRFFWNPAWSPDGKSIAFENLGISVIDVETGVLTQLTKTAGDTNPVWSDDGTRIAFLRNEGTSHGLWVMNADGGNPLQLTSVPGPLEDRLPVWSPDGLTLLFTRNSGLGFGDLWRVPSVGGDRSLFLQNAVADW
jgi:Tol biopolymer transport system component